MEVVAKEIVRLERVTVSVVVTVAVSHSEVFVGVNAARTWAVPTPTIVPMVPLIVSTEELSDVRESSRR